jgi:hypothetical protein
MDERRGVRGEKPLGASVVDGSDLRGLRVLVRAGGSEENERRE